MVFENEFREVRQRARHSESVICNGSGNARVSRARTFAALCRKEMRFGETPRYPEFCPGAYSAVSESKIYLDVALVLFRRAGRVERNVGDGVARPYEFVFD